MITKASGRMPARGHSFYSRTLLVPTLNEITGMKAIMPRVREGWVDQILVVDGGSTDGTVEYAMDMGYDVVTQEGKGMRNAYRSAWPHVTGAHVVTFSPDGNSIPELIPKCFEELEQKGAMMCIVSRYKKPAKSYDDDWLTGFGNALFTKTINVLHGGNYTDAMVIFRGFHRLVPWSLGLFCDRDYRVEEKLFRTNISWEPLMSVRAAKYKLKVSEIAGDEPARVGGERKLQVFKWGAAYMLQILREAIT